MKKNEHFFSFILSWSFESKNNFYSSLTCNDSFFCASMPKGIRLMRKKSTGYEMINKLVYYENINSVRTVELFSGDISHITE